jgi:hypothetical protein
MVLDFLPVEFKEVMFLQKVRIQIASDAASYLRVQSDPIYTQQQLQNFLSSHRENRSRVSLANIGEHLTRDAISYVTQKPQTGTFY